MQGLYLGGVILFPLLGYESMVISVPESILTSILVDIYRRHVQI
jgi:hypothetical protein